MPSFLSLYLSFNIFFIHNWEGKSRGEEYLYYSLNKSYLSLVHNGYIRNRLLPLKAIQDYILKLRLYMRSILLCMCTPYILIILFFWGGINKKPFLFFYLNENRECQRIDERILNCLTLRTAALSSHWLGITSHLILWKHILQLVWL